MTGLGKARMAGIALLAAIALFATLGPALIGVDPAAQRYDRLLLAPSFADPFGTDELGRSLLARVAAAARLSLGLGLIAVATGATIGTLAGVAAAWFGGWAERLIATLADAALAVPGLILVLLMIAVLPGDYLPIYLGFALALWVEYFRITRALAAAVLAAPAVEASRLLGFGRRYVVRRHLLPELAPMLLALAPYSLATVVLGLAALGFISIGLHPPTAELGLMMTEYLPYFWEAPWLLTAPVGVLTVTVLALVLIAGRERTP